MPRDKERSKQHPVHRQYVTPVPHVSVVGYSRWYEVLRVFAKFGKFGECDCLHSRMWKLLPASPQPLSWRDILVDADSTQGASRQMNP